MLDQADVRKSGTAYPGTMVVYTAARLRNLLEEDAEKVAQFIRVSTTEGQQPGTGNGELPAGFLPIKKSGVTAKLYDSAQEVADAVEKQAPKPTEPTPRRPRRTRTRRGGGGVPDPPPSGSRRHRRRRRRAPRPTTSSTPEVDRDAGDRSVSTSMGGRLLPGLLIVGLLGVAVASGLRYFRRTATRTGAVTATLPDQVTDPAADAGHRARPAAPSPRSRAVSDRRDRPRARPATPSTILSSTSTMVALVCLWVVAQLLFLSGLSQARQQDLLYTRVPRAAGRRPRHRSARSRRPVTRSRCWASRASGCRQVVVEGTASGDTLAGPGHLRNTVAPGPGRHLGRATAAPRRTARPFARPRRAAGRAT